MRREKWFDGGGGGPAPPRARLRSAREGEKSKVRKMKEMEKWRGSVGFGVIRGRRLCLVWCNKGGI